MKKPLEEFYLFHGNRAIVLSSGGIDSTTCVAYTVDYFGKQNVCTVSFLYGQKHSKELDCAKAIADYYGVNHYVLNISEILKYSDCPLMQNSTKDVELGSYSDQVTRNKDGMVSTYVPFRNGLMLSAAASLAFSLNPEEKTDIVIGAHADDAAGNAYADCSFDFISSIDEAINIGTYGKIGIVAPFVNSNKSQVVACGLKLKVPYNLTWSCYLGGNKACGKCGTCIDRINAFKLNGVVDPIEYEVN